MAVVPVAAAGAPAVSRARRPGLVVAGLFGLCLLAAFGTMGLGAVRVPQPHAIEALFGHGTQDQIRTIRDYEFPRILVAFLVGASLAISGGVIQGVTRNPLAAPDTIGVVKGAALGAVILLLAYPRAALSYLPLSAFVGGIGAMVLVYLVSYKHGSTTPVRLVLVGVAVSAFCESIIRYVMLHEAKGIGQALVWLSGSLASVDMQSVYQILPWIAVLVPLLVFFVHKLDVLGLGDDLASGLGVPVERTRRITLLIAVLLASACVSVAGSIIFIALIAPHIARRLVGSRHAYLLPAAAAIGAFMLLISDAIGRGADPPIELPAGMVTAIIGAPYFIYLLMRKL
jgi:ferric citrate transport system permease protein